MRPLAERFWEQVTKGDRCWEWTGTTNSDGYGTMWVRGRPETMHRLSWELHNGAAAPGLCVCHACDNRKCVRPGHLFLGTSAENTADRHGKGRTARGPGMQRNRRHATGDANGSRTKPERLKRGDAHYYRTNPELIPQGGAHPRAKLTDAQARGVRARVANGEKRPDVAASFGVTIHVINDICSGRTYQNTNQENRA